MLKNLLRPIYHKLQAWNTPRLQSEVDLLYTLLYQIVHDNEHSPDLIFSQTKNAFAHQWQHLEEGKALLSHPWFEQNVHKILSEQELQIRPEWFHDKKVLDAGCGNGRWSYGFSRLGANITSVDVNPIAVEKTKQALSCFNNPQQFIISGLESLSQHLEPNHQFDLVFSWGVLHHTQSFNQSFNELMKFVKTDGMVYLYLYGRESISLSNDVKLFKQRIAYNLSQSAEDAYQFLLKKAKGNPSLIHNLHDQYAPLINRRFDYTDIYERLEQHGFESITRTLQHPELFIRAIKTKNSPIMQYLLPAPQPPYWIDLVLKK